MLSSQRHCRKLKMLTRSEEGSLTIFALFIFVLILMIAGMAVDMVRHEHERLSLIHI